MSITTTLKQGSNGSQVKELQTFLNSQGYNLTVDGDFGALTAQAVKSYQSKNGLTADGIVGSQTIAKINTPSQNTNQSQTTPQTTIQNNSNTASTSTTTSPTQNTSQSTQPNSQSTFTNSTGTYQPTTKYDNDGNPYTVNIPVTPTSQSNSTTNNSSTTDSTSIPYDSSLANSGITQEIYNQMSPTQQAVVSAAIGAAKSLYGANASNVTLQSALEAASNDPTIISKYSEALKIDTNTFQNSLQQIQQSTSTQSQQQQTQFENERKALAESQASAGTAYSGFRKQAENQLAQSENNIVESSRSQSQKELQDLTNAFEQKYGSSATPTSSQMILNPLNSSQTSISGLATNNTPTYDTIESKTTGGITGTQPIAKQQEINSLASNYVTLGQTQ